jgi:hypothetical protein
MLGRQPVVHRHHHGGHVMAQGAANLVVGLEVADHEAAAVHEEQQGKRPLRVGLVDTRRQRAAGSVDDMVVRRRDGRRRQAQAGGQVAVDLARHRRRQRLQRRVALGGGLRQKAGQRRV